MVKEVPIVTIPRPEGTYSVLYGIHIKTQQAEDLPEDTTGVVLETGIHSYLDTPEKTIEHMRHHVQYRELFSLLEKKKIPIFFVDLKYRYPDPLLLLADTAFSGMEYIAGIHMIKKGKEKPANFFLGAWLLLPFISNVLRLGSAFTGVGLRESGTLKKFSHRLHPEADFLYLTLRNAVIAEKVKYILNHVRKQSHVVTVLGAGHVGIEDMFQVSDENRRSVLHRFSALIKKIVRNDYFYTILQYEYSGTAWKVEKEYEVPVLKSFITGSDPRSLQISHAG